MPVLGIKSICVRLNIRRGTYSVIKEAMMQRPVLDQKISIESEVIEPLPGDSAFDFDYVIGDLYRQLHEDL